MSAEPNADGNRPPQEPNVWVPIARYVANKAVEQGTRLLEVLPQRSDPAEAAQRARQRRERRLEQEKRRAETAQARERAASPLIYIPALTTERPAPPKPRTGKGSIGRSMPRAPGWLIWFLIAALLTIPALAVEPGERLQDPGLEQRARDISLELRCLVCQNQSIDDSNAELAKDLRVLVRERLVAGDSNDQVISFVRDRYGDFVLLKPPFQPNTYVLWLAPFVVLALGGAGVIAFFWSRRRHAVVEPAPLTAEEQAHLAQLTASAPRR